jgi:plastocyanin
MRVRSSLMLLSLAVAGAWSCSGGGSGDPGAGDSGADASTGGASGAGGGGATAGASGSGGGVTGGASGSGGAATGGASGSAGSGGIAGSSGSGGAGDGALCGCTEAAALDLSAQSQAEIFFGFSYSPACIKVKVGTNVAWNGPFFSHPMTPFATLGTQPNPIPPTSNGDSMTHTFQSTGSFGYYCTLHGGESEASAGMCGAVFVVP